jgi:hypothetical protein
MYDRLVTKRQRDRPGTEQKERDMQAWVLIGAISSARCCWCGCRSCSAP